jgi:hypothetical protein
VPKLESGDFFVLPHKPMWANQLHHAVIMNPLCGKNMAHMYVIETRAAYACLTLRANIVYNHPLFYIQTLLVNCKYMALLVQGVLLRQQSYRPKEPPDKLQCKFEYKDGSTHILSFATKL